MLGLGVLLAVTLAVANSKLYVYEDPRIDEVEELLPGANCGACGTPGCRAFAEACVGGTVSPGKCSVNTPENTGAIAELLGVDAGGEEKQVARLACAGGNHVAWQRAQYDGVQTCQGATLVSNGSKSCVWGCLGLGDCQTACEFGAITMSAQGLPVVDEDRCTACNACVVACPKDLFSTQPVSHRLWVACKSLIQGDDALEECEVACTGCGRCAMDAPDGLVRIENGLAVVDYSRNRQATPDIIQRCPTGAIVWLEGKGRVRKGAAAKKITRKSPLPLTRGG